MSMQRRDTSIAGGATGFSKSRLGRQTVVSLLSVALLFASLPQKLWAYQDDQRLHSLPPRNQRRRHHTRNRLPSSCSNWWRRLRCIRIRWWHRFWRHLPFPTRWWRPTDGCKRILI